MKQLIASEKGESDGVVPPVPGALLKDADYAIETWLQHRVHHTYPETGGYNDQDESLMLDWKQLNLWYIRLSMGVEQYSSDEVPEFMDVRSMMHD